MRNSGGQTHPAAKNSSWEPEVYCWDRGRVSPQCPLTWRQREHRMQECSSGSSQTRVAAAVRRGKGHGDRGEQSRADTDPARADGGGPGRRQGESTRRRSQGEGKSGGGAGLVSNPPWCAGRGWPWRGSPGSAVGADHNQRGSLASHPPEVRVGSRLSGPRNK